MWNTLDKSKNSLLIWNIKCVLMECFEPSYITNSWFMQIIQSMYCGQNFDFINILQYQISVIIIKMMNILQLPLIFRLNCTLILISWLMKLCIQWINKRAHKRTHAYHDTYLWWLFFILIRSKENTSKEFVINAFNRLHAELAQWKWCRVNPPAFEIWSIYCDFLWFVNRTDNLLFIFSNILISSCLFSFR